MLIVLTIAVILLSIKQLETIEYSADRLAVDVIVVSGENPNSCAAMQERQETIQKILNNIKSNIPTTAIECGEGMWYQIASLNMTDPQQQCPTGWREYSESSVRACGRPVYNSSTGSCANVSYIIDRQYTNVCGRVTGYQIGSPHGIFNVEKAIDDIYVDGVSITHGKNPRQHIWTYIAGLTENSTIFRRRNCLCSDMILGRTPPAFVGNNYYCESANPSDNLNNPGFLYRDDKLWDGRQCEGSCCNNTVPWFSMELPNPSSNDIEIRICGKIEPEMLDFPIEVMDIYIQ